MIFYLNNVNGMVERPVVRKRPVSGDLIVDYLEVGMIMKVIDSFDSAGRRHWRCLILNQTSCKRRLVTEVISSSC